MTEKERDDLRRGDIVQNTGSGDSYIVISNYGGFVTAIREVEVSHLSEWKVVSSHQWPGRRFKEGA